MTMTLLAAPAMRDKVKFCLIICTALGLGGCGDNGPVASSTGTLRVAVHAGANQLGLPDQPLPDPILLQVTDRSGRPIAGATLEVASLPEGGALALDWPESNMHGELALRWTLASDTAAGYTAVVEVSAAGAIARVQLQAGLLPLDRADVVRARADRLPIKLVMLPRVAGPPRTVLIHDTLMHLVPETDRAARDVIAFSMGRRPLILGKAGGFGPDTVALEFPKLDTIALRVTILYGDFETRAAAARRHLEQMEAIWADLPLGLVPSATIRDGTQGSPQVDFPGLPPCSTPAGAPGTRTAIDILYIRSMQYGGYACPAGYVLMAGASDSNLTLLTHEIGHLFGLGHVTHTGNVMHAQLPGRHLTEGQVFQAIFDPASRLNSIYQLLPESEQRDCRNQFGATSLCLPAVFSFDQNRSP